MQIKTTMRYQFTFTKVTIKKKDSVSEGVEKLKPLIHCWWENTGEQMPWKSGS